jgi:hypothetical protein
MVVKNTIKVNPDWDTLLIEDARVMFAEAVRETGVEMAQIAADISRQRSRPGGAARRTMKEITDLKVFQTPNGYEGGIVSPAWYAYFQNDGTLGRRKKPLRASTLERRANKSGRERQEKVKNHPGITPLGFFDAAVKHARKALKQKVESASI